MLHSLNTGSPVSINNKCIIQPIQSESYARTLPILAKNFRNGTSQPTPIIMTLQNIEGRVTNLEFSKKQNLRMSSENAEDLLKDEPCIIFTH